MIQKILLYFSIIKYKRNKIFEKKQKKKELSSLVAETLAKKAKEMKITKVYFDRGIYKYHGRIKLLAEELKKKWNGILNMEKKMNLLKN